MIRESVRTLGLILCVLLVCMAAIACLPREHDIIVRAEPEEGGDVTGGGRYRRGRDIAVKAEPAEGYVFVEWREGDRTLSSSWNYPFVVRDDRVLTAVFAEIEEE